MVQKQWPFLSCVLKPCFQFFGTSSGALSCSGRFEVLVWRVWRQIQVTRGGDDLLREKSRCVYPDTLGWAVAWPTRACGKVDAKTSEGSRANTFKLLPPMNLTHLIFLSLECRSTFWFSHLSTSALLDHETLNTCQRYSKPCNEPCQFLSSQKSFFIFPFSTAALYF